VKQVLCLFVLISSLFAFSNVMGSVENDFLNKVSVEQNLNDQERSEVENAVETLRAIGIDVEKGMKASCISRCWSRERVCLRACASGGNTRDCKKACWGQTTFCKSLCR